MKRIFLTLLAVVFCFVFEVSSDAAKNVAKDKKSARASSTTTAKPVAKPADKPVDKAKKSARSATGTNKGAAKGKSSARSATGSNKASGGGASKSGSGKKAESKKPAASKSSGKKEKKDTSKKSSKKSSSSEVEEESECAEDDEECVPAVKLSCPEQKAIELTQGACAFAAVAVAEGAVEKPNMCVYQSRDSGKTQSIYNTYLLQNYGVSEAALKEGSAVVNVRYRNKGMAKYWNYLASELDRGSLTEGKILDGITAIVIEESEVESTNENYITDKEVEFVPLSSDITTADIKACTDAAKSALAECKQVATDLDFKKKVADSCAAYDGALAKIAAEARTDAMTRSGEILNILLTRATNAIASQQAAVDNKNALTAIKGAEAESKLAQQAAVLIAERTELVEPLATGSVKESNAERFIKQNEKVCEVEMQIQNLTPNYKPSDMYGCAKLNNSAPPAAAAPVAADSVEEKGDEAGKDKSDAKKKLVDEREAMIASLASLGDEEKLAKGNDVCAKEKAIQAIDSSWRADDGYSCAEIAAMGE